MEGMGGMESMGRKRERRRRPEYEIAPTWLGDAPVEGSRECPELVWIDVGDEAGSEWAVASRAEVEEIADADSFMGSVLRPRTAVVTLANLSYN